MRAANVIKQMKTDSRFYIDDVHLNYLRGLWISTYSIEKRKLGSLRRDYDDGLYSLEKSVPFRVLAYPEDEKTKRDYEKYCTKRRNQIGDIDRGLKAFRELHCDLLSMGYSLSKGAIVVDQYNIVLDGQHRSCIMLYEYGPEYEAEIVCVCRPIRNPRTIIRLLRARTRR